MSHSHRRLLPPSDSFGKKVSNKENPRVFLDISVDGDLAERMVIELFANVVPITAENFRALCTGEKGKGQTTGKPLHYKGTVFHSIHRGLFAQGGDISGEPDGRGTGESIYGGYFKDENFKLRHSEAGMLSMGDGGPDTNGSQFYITLRRQHLLDGFHVVFGKVIRGRSTLCRINEMGTSGGQPSGVVQITDCGELSQDKGKMKESLKRASCSVERVKEHSDEREKQRKNSPSEGLLQISDVDEISEYKKNNDQGKIKESLKRASSSNERVKEHNDEREKRRKYSSSEGLLQVSDGDEISEDKENNLMKSDQDRGFSREQVGADSFMELRQQIDWMMASIREIARALDVHLPDYPLPHPQQDEFVDS